MQGASPQCAGDIERCASNAGGDLRISGEQYIPDTFGERGYHRALDEDLCCLLPDGELSLVNNEPSAKARRARARPHFGAAAHQQSFKELGLAHLGPRDTAESTPQASHDHDQWMADVRSRQQHTPLQRERRAQKVQSDF